MKKISNIYTKIFNVLDCRFSQNLSCDDEIPTCEKLLYSEFIKTFLSWITKLMIYNSIYKKRNQFLLSIYILKQQIFNILIRVSEDSSFYLYPFLFLNLFCCTKKILWLSLFNEFRFNEQNDCINLNWENFHNHNDLYFLQIKLTFPSKKEKKTSISVYTNWEKIIEHQNRKKCCTSYIITIAFAASAGKYYRNTPKIWDLSSITFISGLFLRRVSSAFFYFILDPTFWGVVPF